MNSRFGEFVAVFGLSLNDFTLDENGNMVLTDEAEAMLDSYLTQEAQEGEVYGG